jgi:uncharacterized protein (TIRG00374 family)
LIKSNKGKYISYTARLAVAAAALYLVFRGQDLKTIGRLLTGLNLWIVLFAAGTMLANQLLFVARWVLLLKVQSVNIGYWAALRLHLLGRFYNNCLPTSIGGDLLRAWYVTKHTNKKVEAAFSVFVDRLVGLSGLFLIAILAYWLIPVENGATPRLEFRAGFFEGLVRYWWIFAVAGAACLFVVAGFLVNSKGRELLNKWMKQSVHRVHASLSTGYKSIVTYWNHKTALVLAYVLTFLCHGVLIVGMVFVGRDIGIESAARDYFVFFPAAWIAGALPISVGGLGIWEEVLKLLFVGVGANAEKVIALAIFQRLLWICSSLPGVVIHLSGSHLPRDFSVEYDDTEC